MPVIPCNPGMLHWQGAKHGDGGSFRPNGKIMHVLVDKPAVHANPRTFDTAGEQTLAARLFVGFNVGGKPRWKLTNVIAIVSEVRVKQKREPDASFIAQKGIFTSAKSGDTIVEDGAQIIIINLRNDPLKVFRKDMETLAETIARKLKQELVILELQRAGITLRTIGIRP